MKKQVTMDALPAGGVDYVALAREWQKTNGVVVDMDAPLEVGAEVVDLTAVANGWPDDLGEILEIEGPHVAVRYSGTGTVRHKMFGNLCRIRRQKARGHQGFYDMVMTTLRRLF